MRIWNFIQERFRNGDIVIRLILINLFVFVVLQVYFLMGYLMDTNLDQWLGNDLHLATSSDWHVLMRRPWSIITHLFTHIEFGHLFFNMMALYFIGDMMLRMLGSKSVLTAYLLGGLSGFLLFFILYNTMPRYDGKGVHGLVGASGGVLAMIVATASYAPKMEVRLFGIWKLPLGWLAAILVLVDLVTMRNGYNNGGQLAHLGGAAFGYFYGSGLRNGNSMFGFFENWMSRLTQIFKPRKGIRVEYKHDRPKSDEQFNAERKVRQERIDAILDKISKSGYDSLSKEEKEMLFRHSQK